MNTRMVENRMRMFATCFLIFLATGMGSIAMAWGGGGFHGGGYRGGGGFHGGGFHGYGWSGGFYYNHYWGGFYIGPVWYANPTIVVAGIPYYNFSGVYYTPYGDELVAVAPPVVSPTVVQAPSTPTAVVSAPAKVETKEADQKTGDIVIINIPKAGGGHTPVKLVKTEKGYVGPQGEFYAGHPTVDQLKVLYGE